MIRFCGIFSGTDEDFLSLDQDEDMEPGSLRIIGDFAVEREAAQAEVDQIVFAHNLLFPAFTLADGARFRTEDAVDDAPAAVGGKNIFAVNRVNRARVAVEVFAQVIVKLERVASDCVASDFQNDLIVLNRGERDAQN